MLLLIFTKLWVCSNVPKSFNGKKQMHFRRRYGDSIWGFEYKIMSNGLKYLIFSLYICYMNYLNIKTLFFHIWHNFSSRRSFTSLGLNMLMKNVLLISVEQRYGLYTIISITISCFHEFLQLYFKQDFVLQPWKQVLKTVGQHVCERELQWFTSV